MSRAQRVYVQEIKKAQRGYRQRRSAVIDTQQQQQQTVVFVYFYNCDLLVTSSHELRVK